MQQGTGRALDQQLDRGGQSGPGMQPLLDHQPEHHPRAVDAAPELSTGLLLQILKQTHRYCPLVKIENLITRGRVHSKTLTDKFVLGEILGQFPQGMADHRVSLESTTLAWACYRPEHNPAAIGISQWLGLRLPRCPIYIAPCLRPTPRAVTSINTFETAFLPARSTIALPTQKTK